MVAVGENLVLIGQVGAAGIDKVEAGQTAFLGDLLRAQVFLDGHRIVGAALHGGVVADDHDVLPHDPADPGDQPGAGRVAAVKPVRRRRADLKERATRVEQVGHPFARRHLAPRDMALARLFAAAGGGKGRGLRRNCQSFEMRGAVGRGLFRTGQEVGRQFHPIAPMSSRPISIRRISLVPAPISISLASRKMRATAESFRNPAPPMA